ncbi:MAG TPA: sigma-70 family RNA polymerase sigma factor [Opitutaceae bacterium]|nr:sigma-70 family RNA polymerase sigma factor [Opitutaceae bacterium]
MTSPLSLRADESTFSAHAGAESSWFVDDVQPHESKLRAYLKARFPTLNDVDDLLQETYTRLIKARASGKGPVSGGYLFVTARNLALDLLRRREVVPMGSLEEDPVSRVLDDRPDAAESLSREQELELLADAIRALPERCREIVRLRRLEGLSHREIADRLGIREATVNAQLAIGLIRCRKYLCAHGVAKACIQNSASHD